MQPERPTGVLLRVLALSESVARSMENRPDPETLAKLETLKPRDELVQRLALRERFDELASDPLFKERVKFLLEMLNPYPAEMAEIMAEVRAVERGEVPPPPPAPIEDIPAQRPPKPVEHQPAPRPRASRRRR